MKKIAGFALLLAGAASTALAGAVAAVPEIDPGSAISALVLLGGAALIIRSRMRR